MKKIFLVAVCCIALSGCAKFNEAKDDITTYEKEETKCVEGNKVWIYKIGKENSSSITSQIIGKCEVDE